MRFVVWFLLFSVILEDPKAWGYLPIGGMNSYIADRSLSEPPFELHIVGSGWLLVPVELENVVTIHSGYNYSEFYNFVGSMDICVPAFSDNGYYEAQASSTVVMAVQCNVSLQFVDFKSTPSNLWSFRHPSSRQTVCGRHTHISTMTEQL